MTDKLFRVISFLIVAAGLALAAAPSAALADHCKGKHKNDLGCDTSGGKPPKDTEPANPVIAFATSRFSSDEIRVMDADGGNQTVVLDNPGGGASSSRRGRPTAVSLPFMQVRTSSDVLASGLSSSSIPPPTSGVHRLSWRARVAQRRRRPSARLKMALTTRWPILVASTPSRSLVGGLPRISSS